MSTIYTDPTTQKQVYDLNGQKIDVSTGNPIIPASLSTTALTPVSSPTITQPTYPLPPALPSADTSASDQQLGPKETEASDLIKQIEQTNLDISGKEAYRTEQEQGAGLMDLQKSEADLTAQLKQLQAEATNIPNVLQLQAEGRGITAGGLEPIQASELRKVSIKANTVGALLAATQGKIGFAQSQIDRVVQAKYGPMEAKRDAMIQNLNLRLKDPALTLEEKNRAARQLVAQEKAKDADAKKKTDAATILKWATDAIQNGATTLQAQQIADIGSSNNPDLQKAFALYAPFAKKQETTTSGVDLAEFKQFFPNVDITTPAGRQQFLNFQAQKAAAGRISTTGGALSILDIGRYNDLYPEAGVTAGDTQEIADAKVAALNTPEAKIRSLVVAAQSNGNSYEKVVEEIKNDATIKDKAMALKIAAEVYGVAAEAPAAPIFGKGNFANVDINTRAQDLVKTFGSAMGVRTQLIKDGYDKNAATTAANKVGNIADKFVNTISNYLFGE